MAQNFKKSAVSSNSDMENKREIQQQQKRIITLKVGSELFPAQVSILASRSPVFAAMFNHNTQEKESGIIEITDFSSTTVANMLHYIYKDELKTDDTEDLADLYAASDKYGLIILKNRISSLFIERMNLENISYFSVLGYAHNDNDLMNAVKSKARENHSWFTSEDFSELCMEYPDVANDLVRAASNELFL